MKRAAGVRACRACGCTDLNCSQCIVRTGQACHWVEPDLCSACHDLGYNTLIKVKTGNTNIARARVGARVFTASSTMSGEQACLVVAQKAAAALRADSARIERYKHLSMFVSRAVLYLKFSAKAVPA